MHLGSSFRYFTSFVVVLIAIVHLAITGVALMLAQSDRPTENVCVQKSGASNWRYIAVRDSVVSVGRVTGLATDAEPGGLELTFIETSAFRYADEPHVVEVGYSGGSPSATKTNADSLFGFIAWSTCTAGLFITHSVVSIRFWLLSAFTLIWSVCGAWCLTRTIQAIRMRRSRKCPICRQLLSKGEVDSCAACRVRRAETLAWVAKWTSLAIGLLGLSAYVLSAFVFINCVTFYGDAHTYSGLGPGCLYHVKQTAPGTDLYAVSSRWSYGRYREARQLIGRTALIPSIKSSSTARSIRIPLWVPVFVGLLPTLMCWCYYQRVRSPHHCRKCGYDLRDNLSGICPECGLPRYPGPSDVHQGRHTA
jgi:hypothetical protein